MREKQLVYHSYILRLWHEKGAQKTTWRVAILDTQTGKRYGFDGFNGLVQFLKEKTIAVEMQNVRKENYMHQN